jgi:hypothetical protein
VPADSISTYRKKVDRMVLASRAVGVLVAIILFAVLAGGHIIIALIAALAALGVFIVLPYPYVRSIQRTVHGRDVTSPRRRQLGR